MTRVPYTGNEKASLTASLDRHRDAVLWKLEGLDDAALRRPVVPTGTTWFGDTVTLRWVLIHVIEDTARHAGHADILHELIDGSTGDHRRDGPGEAIPAWPGS